MVVENAQPLPIIDGRKKMPEWVLDRFLNFRKLLGVSFVGRKTWPVGIELIINLKQESRIAND